MQLVCHSSQGHGLKASVRLICQPKVEENIRRKILLFNATEISREMIVCIQCCHPLRLIQLMTGCRETLLNCNCLTSVCIVFVRSDVCRLGSVKLFCSVSAAVWQAGRRTFNDLEPFSAQSSKESIDLLLI